MVCLPLNWLLLVMAHHLLHISPYLSHIKLANVIMVGGYRYIISSAINSDMF